MKTITFLLLFALTAAAQTIDDIRPDCAIPGGRLLICGNGFGDDPEVTIGRARARVLRSHDTKILVRVPGNLAPGEALIEVGAATARVDVLAARAPVVRRLSSHTATPGQVLVVVGRNLANSEAAFLSEDGSEVATVTLRGRARVGYLRVPRDLATGKYTLEFTNDAGSSGACSPVIRIVESGPPTLESIAPENQHPGRAVVAAGTDLGPIGLCVAIWTRDGGGSLAAGGFANGYDKVFTYVPPQATAGVNYKVHLEFSDGSSTADTGLLEYTVGTSSGPRIDALAYDEGPAGSPLGIYGESFFPTRANADRALAAVNAIAIADALPLVEFTRDGVAHKARILFGVPGKGDEGDFLVVRVPEVQNGEYDLTVRVGSAVSNAVTFTVKSMPLTVTSMKPAVQSSTGFVFPVLFTGTGFGSGLDRDDIAVTWESDGSDPILPRRGRIILRNDREMLVVPPGASTSERLAPGKYTVRVTRFPGTDREVSVVAGTYTVE
ncbi:MAG: IPT/TIG domain-containing protein [Planctomycetota bacterium]|jgi:hypothetical protein